MKTVNYLLTAVGWFALGAMWGPAIPLALRKLNRKIDALAVVVDRLAPPLGR